jgi:hypothetical protein
VAVAEVVIGAGIVFCMIYISRSTMYNVCNVCSRLIVLICSALDMDSCINITWVSGLFVHLAKGLMTLMH